MLSGSGFQRVLPQVLPHLRPVLRPARLGPWSSEAGRSRLAAARCFYLRSCSCLAKGDFAHEEAQDEEE